MACLDRGWGLVASECKPPSLPRRNDHCGTRVRVTVGPMLGQKPRCRSRAMRSRPRVIDLFAGAGLFSHAFIKTGFDVIQAVEFDKSAAETYAANLGGHVQVG